MNRLEATGKWLVATLTYEEPPRPLDRGIRDHNGT